ncbi:uncharacterized protein LOC108815158 [Raphanus sativus]|uniref:Uncharacterized protein LOC108815158 n=1 Tax=Raphanus sativus TaxID=3726 RepID=A0A6J0K753_RAPSA|nr:uncharacterized protein LOC108815158 [Raphanus sativus]
MSAHHLRDLISNLASSQDAVVNMVAEQVVTCMMCLSCEDFSAFVAYLRKCMLSPEVPYITGLTRGRLNLIAIHNNRENILFEMNQHFTRMCIPAFEDIFVGAEMYNRAIDARDMAIARRNQMGVSSVFQKGESSNSRFLSGQENADERTIVLSFSRRYPVSREEVHGYFTWRFGEIIEAIHMGGAGRTGQTLYAAAMVLNSPAMIPAIIMEGISTTKFSINGKHVWARKFIPSHKILFP